MDKFGEEDGILRNEPPAVRKARFQSFLQFFSVVDEINSNPESTFRAENNFLSIMTEEERSLYLGRNNSGSQPEFDDESDYLESHNAVAAAASRDWRGRYIV